MGYPENFPMFQDWQENTQRRIKKARNRGVEISNKQIKKIMIKGFRNIMKRFPQTPSKRSDHHG